MWTKETIYDGDYCAICQGDKLDSVFCEHHGNVFNDFWDSTDLTEGEDPVEKMTRWVCDTIWEEGDKAYFQSTCAECGKRIPTLDYLCGDCRG